MMRQKLMYTICVATALALASASYGVSVRVGDFEGNLDGWYKDAATLSFSTTGATVGTQAMQVDGPGGWKINAKLDVKPHRAALANKGAKITADVTAFAADMTTTWMQVEMVINAQNDDQAGANNNIGWNGLGGQDVVRDGQPHTYTWTLPDTLTGKISMADDNIWWFEFALVSNLDSASVTKFYIDNIQISYEEPSLSVLVSSFESGLEGWYTDTWTAGTTALSATGATAGAQAMQVSGPGGWQQLTKVNVKPYMADLSNKGVAIKADVTAFAADMTTTWMQVGMVLNCEGDNNNGANNNLGWNDLGLLDLPRDGQPHTLTWVLSDALTGKIGGADENIGWFEFLLISNVDGASTVKFYVDKIQITGVPIPTGKSTDTVIGNFEESMDGWVVGGGADVRFNDHNGVTLDKFSLDVYLPNGDWNQDVLMLNLLDPNNAAALAAFKNNTKITADVTQLVADWPTDQAPGWNGKHLIINAGGDNWSMWQDLGYQTHWTRDTGDLTQTATWDYSPYLSQIKFDNLTWCELRLVENANDAAYTGWVLFYIDNIKLTGGGIPLNPQPANNAIDVDINADLSWTAGKFAKSHNVYLGTARGAVAAADGTSNPDVIFAVVDGASFDPGTLAFDKQYFWRVDPVNDVNPDSPWKGAVWSFTTANFITVDSFESYTNDSPNRLFQAWVDGYGFSADEFFPDGNPGNGSDAAVGHDIWTAGTPYQQIVEIGKVHSGSQAMPLYYNNETKGYSEATRTWAEPQNWTINGFNALKFYVYGKFDNAADPLYVAIEDKAGKAKTVPFGTAATLTTESWTEVAIGLADFTDVNMASVTKMTIGIGSKTAVSKAVGILLIDDIRVGFKPIGLVAHYTLDGDLKDSSGNGHDGTLAGDPNFPAKYVAGPAGHGQAMLFDGTDGHQYVSIGTFNPSAATGKLSLALWAKWDGPSGSWQGLMGKRNTGDWVSSIMMWYVELERDVWDLRFVQPGSGVNSGKLLTVGQWMHLAVTFDGTTAKIYIDGAVAAEGDFFFGDNKEAAMQFGASVDEGWNPFNGALDDVYIYDTVLTEAEIKALAGK